MTRTERQDVASALGEIAMCWNHIELLMRLLFSRFVGGDKTDIITAHLNSTTFVNIFGTIAAEFAEPKLKPFFERQIDFYERMRDYRNYYIHNLSSSAYADDSESPGGFSRTYTAKGRRLVMHEHVISLRDLETCITRLQTLKSFTTRILDEFLARGLHGYRPLSLQEMPPLPDKLVKPRLFPLDAKTQRDEDGIT